MYRVTACLLVLGGNACAAEPPLGETVRLTVSPAAAPKPSLKYRLLPPRAEWTPGNAATLYYRALAFFVENRQLLQDLHEGPWNKWLATSLEDLPKEEVGEKVNAFRHLLREVELAGRCRDCDWQVGGRPEGIGLLLPDMGGFRMMGNVLAVRARWQIARGEWEGATLSLQAGFALARNLTRGPSFMHVMVGLAISRIFAARVDEFIGQPGAPNLYWALSVLPRPFTDPLPALDDGRLMLEHTWPWLKKLDGPALSPEQVKAGMAQVRKVLADFNVRYEDNLPQRLARGVVLDRARPAAKKALEARGMPADLVAAMPAEQVVALHLYQEYLEGYDEAGKWAHVPGGYRQPGFVRAREQCRRAVQELDLHFFRGLLTGLGGLGVADLETVSATIDRLDRRLAALRCVEALRLYAAAHEGKWPATLAAIEEVPAPVDPVTGRPFEYKVDGDQVTLSAAAVPGVKLLGELVFEVKMRR